MQGSPQDILYPWVWIIQIFLQVQNTVSLVYISNCCIYFLLLWSSELNLMCRSKPMLDRYISEYIVSLHNFNSGIKEPIQPISIFYYQIFILGRYHKMRESLYSRVLDWVNTILILGWYYLSMKVLGSHLDPNGINNNNILKYPYPSTIKKFKNLNF